MIDSLQPVLDDNIYTQNNIIRCQVDNNHFFPEINQNDFIFVDRDDTNLRDGLVYLFTHKNREIKFICRVAYTLKDELKLCFPTSNEVVDEKLADSLECIGRVRKRVAIIEDQF